MRLILAGMLLSAASLGVSAEAASPPGQVARCIEASAAVYRLPPIVIVILLNVEGGSLGAVTQNTNGTVDIGPMQVNTIWVQRLARHWQASTDATYAALRDDFCANVEAGSWILRQALDEAGSDFWEGVGLYHSHDSDYKADYLRKVLQATLSLQEQARRAPAATLRPTVSRRIAASHSVPEG